MQPNACLVSTLQGAAFVKMSERNRTSHQTVLALQTCPMMNAPATEVPVTTKAAVGSVSYDSTMTDFAAEEAKNTVDLSSPSSTPKKVRGGDSQDAGKQVLEAIDQLVDQVRAAEEHKARLAHLGDTLGPELTPKLEQKVRRKSKVSPEASHAARTRTPPSLTHAHATVSSPRRSCKRRSAS